MNNRRSSREGRKRGIRETIPGRIPKKNRGRSDSNGSSDGQREEEGAVIEKEEETLDPVAAARKALEMFEEVSGEAVMHKTAKVPEMGGQRSGDERQRYKKSRSKTSDQRIKSKDAEQREQTKEEKAEKRRKIEEEARQKKRIEAGEAKRKEFRPKIVSLQESNCLL